MKKIVSFITVLSLMLTLAACSGGGTNDETKLTENSEPLVSEEADTSEATEAEEGTTPKAEGKSLVVYFSWSGNTENVAKSVQSQTGADIFKIEPAVPYSDDYNTVVDLAQEEKRNSARPEISGTVENIEQYDVIYVGFPNWWGDMPMILYTFFESYDLSGKTVAPFCTSGGSGLSDTVNTIKSLEPNATVTDGLHIGSGASYDPDSAVSKWLKNINIK